MTASAKNSTAKDTRLTIVDAARSHIYQHGYATTSYANVAQETDLAKGNIQHYFKSKSQLLEAVIEQYLQGVKDQLANWSLDCGTAYDCIERFVSMVEDNAENLSLYGCPVGTLNSELGKDNRQEQALAKQVFDLYLRWLEARFRSFLSREEAELNAEHLMIMAQGASVIAHTYENPEVVHRQTKLMRQWLLEVCGGRA